MNISLSQVVVPIVTPFTDDSSSLSEVRLARVIRQYVQHGFGGVVVGGPAGESGALGHSEKKQLFEWAARSAGTMPVFASVHVSTTASALDLVLHAGDVGARGALVSFPDHMRLTAEERSGFCAALRRHSAIPIYVFGIQKEDELEGTVMAAMPVHGVPTVLMKPTADEAFFAGMEVSPLAQLGGPRMTAVLERWEEFSQRVTALYQHAGGARVGKAILEQGGLDVGGLRPPVRGLDARAGELLSAVLKAI